jgi:hypothetical protein
MRLIDADALRIIKVEECEGYTIDYYAAGWKACIDRIKTLPTVDAVPVVRCKDCKHWCTDSTPCLQDADAHFCAMVDFYSTSDWFCAYGERKEGSK